VVLGGRHELTTEARVASRMNDPIRLCNVPSRQVFLVRGKPTRIYGSPTTDRTWAAVSTTRIPTSD